MKSKFELTVLLALAILLSPHGLRGQQTSRVIPFSNVKTTIAASTPGQALTVQLWDAAAVGALMYCEDQTLDVDANQAIAFSLGAGKAVAPPCPSNPPGLDPADFPSGASRFLDVVVSTTGVSVLAARIPLNATAFALSPGPAGPKGDKGDTGSPGLVNSVTGGDASIAVGGTPANPTVSVAAGGINDSNVANGALSPAKITGTAATLGANSFNGNQSITGNLRASDGAFGGNFPAIVPITLTAVSNSLNGIGVAADAGAVGVFGESTSGRGVEGDSTSSFGVVGITKAAHTFTQSAVYGLSEGDGGIGVIGEANNGNAWGVYGKTATGVGVVGESTGTGLAGMFNGKVQVNGTTATQILQITGGADLAERFEVHGANQVADHAASKTIEPGMVVVIDPRNSGKLSVSNMAYDPRAAGVISGAGGITTGMLMGQSGSIADGDQPIALVGRVYCWADASNDPIEPGDLLTTSDTPGHAMKATDHQRAPGAIVGKALTGLRGGRGLILVLVTLR